MTAYQHKQRGGKSYLVLCTIAAGAFVLACILQTRITMDVASGLIAIAAVFSSLTIRVDDRGILWRYLFGFPSGSIDFTAIRSARIMPSQPGKWRPIRFQAIEITKTDGALITLGTDDPQGLLEAIERFRRGAA